MGNGQASERGESAGDMPLRCGQYTPTVKQEMVKGYTSSFGRGAAIEPHVSEPDSSVVPRTKHGLKYAIQGELKVRV